MPNNKESLPAEILHQISEYLDKSSLYNCLKVCRPWSVTLYPYAWVALTKQQWCDPTFPIRPATTLFAPFVTENDQTNAENLLYCLKKTRSLEWSDNPALRRPLRWRDSIHTPLSHVSLPTFEILGRMMPQLTHLSLIVAEENPSVAGLLPLLTPSNFPKLQSLVLDLPHAWANLDMRPFYPLLSKLEELDIRGCWYDDPIGNSAPSPPSIEEQWKLKKLTLDLIVAPFLKYCVALESLSFPQMLIVAGGHGFRPFMTSVMKELLTMPKLKTITFEGLGQDEDDVFRIQGPMPTVNTSGALWKASGGPFAEQMVNLAFILRLLRV